MTSRRNDVTSRNVGRVSLDIWALHLIEWVLLDDSNQVHLKMVRCSFWTNLIFT